MTTRAANVVDETFEEAKARAAEDIEKVKAEKPEKEDKPPKRKQRAKTSTSGGKLTDAQIKSKLDEVWVGLGGGLMMFDPWCGTTLATNGPMVSDALVEIAKVNPRVRAALTGFAEVSTWGALLGAAGAVVMPILAHHTNLIPGSLGVMMGPTDELRAAVGDEKAEDIITAMQRIPEAHDFTDESDRSNSGLG